MSQLYNRLLYFESVSIRIIGLVCLAAILQCTLNITATAQGLVNLDRINSGERYRSGSLSTMERSFSNHPVAIDPLALEKSIDPDEYLLTPGDQLILYIGGATDLLIDLQLAADGSLVVPSVGVFEAGGATLTAIRGRVGSACNELYGQSEVSLSLHRPANLRIAITGLLTDTGVFEVPGLSRLGDLIWIAGGLRAGADSRAIEITASDGASRAYDLLTWQLSGVAVGNPVLRSGDRVHVPAAHNFYRVRGIVPSTFERQAAPSSPLDRPFITETLSIPALDIDRLDFVIAAAGGFGSHNCENGVTVLRCESTQSAPAEYWVPYEAAAGFTLEPGDIIEMPFCQEWVSVAGSVTRPGLYPYLPGETVAGYIFAAGGPTRAGRNNNWKFLPNGDGDKLHAAPADTVGAGTIISVPERKLNKLTSVLAPLASVAALVVSVIAISR